MPYHFFPYIAFLSVSALVTTSLALYSVIVFRTRSGQTPFCLWMALCSLWSLSNAFELMATTLAAKLFWANLQYAAYAFFPVLYVVLAMQVAGLGAMRIKALKPYQLIFLLIIPCLTTIFVWFDAKYALVRTNFSLAYNPAGFFYIRKSYRPWFFIHTVYSYALYLCGVFILFDGIITGKNRLYRMQELFFLTGTAFLFIPNILYVTGVGPVKSFDVTPALFCVTGFLIFIAVFKYRFLNVIPLARGCIFENSGEGFIVTDTENRILEVNNSALTLFGVSEAEAAPGNAAQNVFPALFADTPCHALNDRRVEIVKSTVGSRKGEDEGCIYTVRDVTQLYQTQQELFKQREELVLQTEQQRVARDLHDNIGQILSFTNIQAQSILLEIENGNTSKAADYAQSLQKAAEKAYAELRAYIFNLRQPSLLSQPFQQLLEEFAQSVRPVLKCELTVSLPASVPHFFERSEIKSHLLSFTKEAVNNAAKHSQCTQITVGLSLKRNSAEFFVADDGTGFSVEELTISGNTRSSGLRIMEERSVLTGGAFDIVSEKGKGTKVAIRYENIDC